ncbi:class I SAM-dependent rRNA methyltransferase [Gilvibacter sediminis]|uniref:class I SAM-dependent rRNA methyltransferase n=1 Tax=Gilvibacter sediminis TaxID=379071 RepID=UPI00234FC6DE|nr:class I SAM-dependent rRNA methyltransferase [Gilvibacter sediminis]MDC7998339.1 class I SAM-dependent rRNA methyltransferase [Gilvibacter sediminis]
MSEADFKSRRIAVKLNKAGQRSVKQGHPWIFQDAIVKASPEPVTGDLAVIYDNHTDKLIGLGYFDMESSIRIKLLHSGKGADIDQDFFKTRIAAAYGSRIPLLEQKTNGYRLIFGENDGLPGLIIDVYAGVAVIKLYSGIWLQHLKWLPEFLVELIGAEVVVLRLSRNMQRALKSFTDGELLHGALNNADVIFKEHGLNFYANVIKGHKTGYFLDHRHNRKQVGSLAGGKTVLDVFAYAGGFSVHALAGGAKEVTSVDLSAQALELAKANAAVNPHQGKHHCLAGDAFEILQALKEQYKQFDIVVIDPPAFAKKQEEISRAKKAYSRLVKLGADLVAPGGLLVMASCSSRISSQAFFDLVADTLAQKEVRYKLWKQTTHDLDHPIGFEQGAYLKCGYYKFK